MSLKYKLNTLPEATTELNQSIKTYLHRSFRREREKRRMPLFGKMSKTCDSDLQETKMFYALVFCFFWNTWVLIKPSSNFIGYRVNI